MVRPTTNYGGECLAKLLENARKPAKIPRKSPHPWIICTPTFPGG